MKITDFDALSFDCYGTLIDWEAGIAAVLGPWARSRGLVLDDEALLTAYSTHEARAEAEHPRARRQGHGGGSGAPGGVGSRLACVR